jgi:hypothetical protein
MQTRLLITETTEIVDRRVGNKISGDAQHGEILD